MLNYRNNCFYYFYLDQLLTKGLFYNHQKEKIYSKISLLRPLEIKTTSLLRPAVASPKWYFPYDIVLDIQITSLI